MKQTMTFLMALAMMVNITACRAEKGIESDGGKAGTVTTYDYRGFSQLRVSGVVKAYVRQGDRYSVEVTESANPNLLTIVEKSGNVLKVQTKTLKKNVSMRGNNDTPVVRITMPRLSGIEGSGATSISVGDLSTGDFSASISGASKLEFGRVKCDALKISCSGASKLQADIQATGDLHVDCSGASKQTLSLSGKRMKLTNTGASKSIVSFKGTGVEAANSGAGRLELTVDCEWLKAQNSGASKFSISGTADKTDIDASGASKINTAQLNKY